MAHLLLWVPSPMRARMPRAYMPGRNGPSLFAEREGWGKRLFVQLFSFRPNKGLLFVCQNCHYTLHADLVGARNVAMRTLLARQDWASTGHLSVAPDVSNAETKAARLRRYAELRWSLDTSPAPLGQGD